MHWEQLNVPAKELIIGGRHFLAGPERTKVREHNNRMFDAATVMASYFTPAEMDIGFI